VEEPANAMAAEIAHNRAALAFRITLDGVADIAHVAARTNGGDAAHQTLVGDLDQALGRALQMAGGIHAARIAVPAVEDEGHVDVDDVALAERLLVRDAVADDVVDGGAARFPVAAVVQRGGQGAVVHAEGEYEVVDDLCRNAGFHDIVERVQALGREPAGLAHAGETLRPVIGDGVPVAGGAGQNFLHGIRLDIGERVR
jgi:hypothetical protein